MVILLAIFQYFIQAVVDLMDKFLISTRKIEPVSYTFFTVATGLILLIIWPFNFFSISNTFIAWNLFSGAVFSLAMYVFFVALSKGDASRVIPYIFGIVPVFDILISFIFGRNSLLTKEVSAVFLLIPGALLVSYQKGSVWGKHIALKTFSAFLFSSYYALWQFASQHGPVLNNLMWNRLGAAIVLIFPLAYVGYRKKVLNFKKIKKKSSTSLLFISKQILGGLNFVLLSFLFVLGKISVINSLQGFRYVFLLVLSLLLTKTRKHLISEDLKKTTVFQKSLGIALILLGAILLFVA